MGNIGIVNVVMKKWKSLKQKGGMMSSHEKQIRQMFEEAELHDKVYQAAAREDYEGPWLIQKALDYQVDGSHYKDMKIQVVEYCMANEIPYMEGNVIKYVSRWRSKNGITDLKKARHYLDLLIEEEEKNGQVNAESTRRQAAPLYNRKNIHPF